MRLDHRLFSWGVFFITLGAIPLAVRGGLVGSDLLVQAWRLWPLALVGVGVGIVLRGTRIAVLGGVVVALAFGVAGGGVLAGGGFDLDAIACSPGSASGPSFARDGTFGATADVELKMRCGDLNVSTTDGAAWTLSGVSPNGREPDFTIAADELSVDGASGEGFPGFGGARDRWDVVLPRGPMLNVSATVNAGRGTLDLRSAHLGSFDLTVNAGDTRVDLDGTTISDMQVTVNAGDARVILPDTSLTGSLTVNAGSIRFCTSPDAALRISTSESVAASYRFDGAGLTKDGSTWTSPNYGTATVRIDLSATANAGDIELNPKDGCR